MELTRKRYLSYSIILIFDVIAFYIALYLAYRSRIFALKFFESYLRQYYPRFPLAFPFKHLLSFWWMPFVFLFMFASEKLYSNRFPFWEETRLLIKSSFSSALIISGILFLGHLTSRTSAVAILFLFFYGVFLFPLFRFSIKRILYKLGIWREKVIIIGTDKIAINTAKAIQNEKHVGYSIEGFISEKKNVEKKELNVSNTKYQILGHLNILKKVLNETGIKTLVLAIPSLSKSKYEQIALNAQKMVSNIFVVPDSKGIALLNTQLFHFFLQDLFLFKIVNNINFLFNRLLKRLFDLIICIFAIPILIPIFLIIAILIKLDSKGPVFFLHERVGYGGKIFKIIKFRTMYSDAQERLKQILETDAEAKKEWETYFKLKNDPRVTRIGRFLRKTSLDELPQVINVLLGQMSLVGPRPVILEELEKYYEDNKEFYFMSKPGISGLWQISGRNELDYESRVRLDTWYVLNWSLWLDIVILIQTIRVVLNREGAY